jgi:putrescine transport system substrate-binding protein
LPAGGERGETVRVQARVGWLIAAVALAPGGCGRERPESDAATAPVAAPDRVVNVYNWGDYIAPGVIEEFTAATGIHVNYDIFDSQEMLETKLLAGRSGYDVVVVTGHFLERLVPAGAFRKLEFERLPGRTNLDAELMAKFALYDPGNAHAVGYTWGTVGIGYDESRLRERAPTAPTDSWRLVYDPAVARRMTSCGISMIDSPSDVISATLAALGFDANHPTPQQLAAAEQTLLGVRPQLRKIDTGNQINDLAGGTICLMVTWSTNVQVARNRAREAGVAADFRYVVPKEGSVAWFDSLAIPADAPHPEAAHAFIEFMLRPDIAARNASYIGSASMNAAATPLVDPSLRDDPGVYPPAELRGRLQPVRARSQARSRAENRIWARFKTGQ